RPLTLVALVVPLVAACGGGSDLAVAAGSSASSSGAAGGGGGIGCLDDQDGGLGAGGAPMCDGPGARFVTSVVSACFGAGQDVGQDMLPGAVAGPPKGGGCCGGSLDVISLGDGGSIIVAFQGNAIVDGPG